MAALSFILMFLGNIPIAHKGMSCWSLFIMVYYWFRRFSEPVNFHDGIVW